METKERRELSPFKERLIEILEARITDIPDEALRLTADETPEDAAERFVVARSARNPWDVAVGPFLDTAGVVTWLQLKNRQNVSNAAERGDLLAVPVGSRVLFPRFQFSEDGQPLPRLREVMRILQSQMQDPWTRALWLNTPVPSLGNHTPADLLHRGDAERVLELAQADVERRAR